MINKHHMSSLRNNAAIRGLTLIEMALVLAILGVLAGVGIQMTSSQMEQRNYTSTQGKLDTIETALRLHIETFKTLPCPAQGILALHDAMYGIEDCHTFELSVDNIIFGVIPTRTLNLPDSYMTDGWGRRIGYAVDSRFTNGDYFDNLEGEISVYDRAPNERTNQQTIEGNPVRAVYLVISYGSNGLGAWQFGGGQKITSPVTGPYEEANAHLSELFDSIFLDDIPHKVGDPELYFDDIVRWKVRYHLPATGQTVVLVE
jgi:prepilin-type N-terminal cleavage/methylation domain-containing protein